MKIFMEIRSCAGGVESAHFAEELLAVYIKYAKKNNISYELVNSGKTFTIQFEGNNKVLSILIDEGGIHRVQRVSETSKQNKMHTSTVSVAILKVPQSDQISIDSKDIKFEAFRSSGNGGQHKNKTNSAVRLTHIPTNTVVVCDNERSQYQNKEFALDILRSRLQYAAESRRNENINANRHNQVGNGCRAEARRTYNYVRNEVTDNITNKSCSIKEFMLKADIAVIK